MRPGRRSRPTESWPPPSCAPEIHGFAQKQQNDGHANQKPHSVSNPMQALAKRPRCAGSPTQHGVVVVFGIAGIAPLSSTTRARSMMRASRPATAPIMPATAVNKKTGATASWMPWVMVLGSVGQCSWSATGKKSTLQKRGEAIIGGFPWTPDRAPTPAAEVRERTNFPQACAAWREVPDNQAIPAPRNAMPVARRVWASRPANGSGGGAGAPAHTVFRALFASPDSNPCLLPPSVYPQHLPRPLWPSGFTAPTPVRQRPFHRCWKDAMSWPAPRPGPGKPPPLPLPLLQALQSAPSKGIPAFWCWCPRASWHPRWARYSASSRWPCPPAPGWPCCTGGVSINPQMMRLRGGADVVVATPGRLLDLVQNNALRLGQVQHLVLDEADRLLDLGFPKNCKPCCNCCHQRRQNLFFSATFPRRWKRWREACATPCASRLPPPSKHNPTLPNAPSWWMPQAHPVAQTPIEQHQWSGVLVS